jgi:hypothetical protein
LSYYRSFQEDLLWCASDRPIDACSIRFLAAIVEIDLFRAWRTFTGIFQLPISGSKQARMPDPTARIDQIIPCANE